MTSKKVLNMLREILINVPFTWSAVASWIVVCMALILLVTTSEVLLRRPWDVDSPGLFLTFAAEAMTLCEASATALVASRILGSN